LRTSCSPIIVIQIENRRKTVNIGKLKHQIIDRVIRSIRILLQIFCTCKPK